MEVLFEIIFQLFFEFLLPVIGEMLFEVAFHSVSAPAWARKALNTVVALIVYLGLGILTGFLSLLIFPHSFVRSSRLHGISLIITPLLAGLTMWGVGRIRRWRGEAVMRLDTFGYGFIFAFGVALMRFLFTA